MHREVIHLLEVSGFAPISKTYDCTDTVKVRINELVSGVVEVGLI